MNEIGGYFELELPAESPVIFPPGVLVNSGRHALEYIILSLGEKVRRILLPFYTCDVVLQPLERLKIPYEFYHINQNLELETLPKLGEGDYIIINNYFGVKDRYLNRMIQEYKNRLIIDNAQAWYYVPEEASKAFYSPRKFFGLPDGGIARTDEAINIDLQKGYSSSRFSHLLKRIEEGASAGYADFKANSATLKSESLTAMSLLTKRLLNSINFESIKEIRRKNYAYLHSRLSKTNKLSLPDIDEFECPMVYPYMAESENLRQHLIENRIFVASYWPGIPDLCPSPCTEYNLSKKILPIPLDQRYGIEDMQHIITFIVNAHQD